MFALMSCKERGGPRGVVPLVQGGGARAVDASAPATQPRRAGRARRSVRYITDRPAPDGALGVRWGMTRAEVLQLNQAASIECRASREYTFCRRALNDVGLPVVATYEFCGEGLCAVAIDAPRTRDESQMTGNYDRLLTTVKQSLGDPSDEARVLGPGCAGHVALCFASKQSELTARWAWRDGPQVQLSVDQDESDAFQAIASVTWLSAARARQQEAADERAPYTPDAAPGDASDDAAPSAAAQ